MVSLVGTKNRRPTLHARCPRPRFLPPSYRFLVVVVAVVVVAVVVVVAAVVVVTVAAEPTWYS